MRISLKKLMSILLAVILLVSIMSITEISAVSEDAISQPILTSSNEEQTEVTEPMTESPTEAPTEATTEAPTEASTESPTEDPTLPTEGTFHVVAGDASLCNGVNWDPVSALNLMTLGKDGVYRITYKNVPAGIYSFKVTTNGAWDIADYNLIGDAKFGGLNAVIAVAQDDSKVTITFKESDMHANAYINDVLFDVSALDPTDPIIGESDYFVYVVLEDGTAEIVYCFEDVINLEIPEEIDGYTVTSIGSDVFNDCEILESVTIPRSVTNIDMYAFSGCTSFTSINVDSDNEYYSSLDGNLYNKEQTELIHYAVGKSDTSFTIPGSVTRVGFCAFSYCDSLVSVTIPGSVTSIDNSAFFGCESLTNISMSKSVTSIGKFTFTLCNNLKDIYYTGSESDWNNITIEIGNGILKLATIHYNPTDISEKPSCNHINTKTTGAKKATYFAKGYTGDKVCTDCGKKISTGNVISKKTLKTPKITVKPAKKSITIQYKKVKDAKGFAVSYKLGKKTYTKTLKTTKSKTVKLKNLKSGKKYTVKVRAYIKSGNKIAYSKWTKPKTVKVK
ncbi:MAG: leucine-rich repeat protein [Ruminococcus sp.]